jgi:hypothetical protein
VRRARSPLATLLSGLLLLVTTSLLAACGGDKKESVDTPEAKKSATAAAEPGTWPLTGLEVAAGDDPALSHPVVVAKIDNSGKEPQAGVSKADLIVEELVEGGITRLAAFYYSNLPREVGPVRSMRFSDIGIVKPVDAVIATSGAAPITISKIKAAGITFFGEGAKGFSRDSGRNAPYNLMADLPGVVSGIDQEATRPADYLPWGPPDAELGGQQATTFNASFSPAHTSQWKFAGGKYTLLNGNAPAKDSFKPDTVVVVRVRTSNAPYLDPAGNPVPETRFAGKGRAMIFHGGKMLRATWTKKGLGATATFSTRAGEVKIPAGHVWIELLPVEGGDVTFQ